MTDTTKPDPFTLSDPDEVLTIGSDEKSDWFRFPKKNYRVEFEETEERAVIRVVKRD